MKKVLTLFAVLFAASMLFAVSYKNNTYQKLADEYTRKAERAMDAGEYALAEEYAAKAEENAALSEAYIKKMLAKAECDKVIRKRQSGWTMRKKSARTEIFRWHTPPLSKPTQAHRNPTTAKIT